MKYKNDEYRTREAGALTGAANLLSVIEWRIRAQPDLLPPALHEELNAPDADLVIVPVAAAIRMEMVVRETPAAISGRRPERRLFRTSRTAGFGQERMDRRWHEPPVRHAP